MLCAHQVVSNGLLSVAVAPVKEDYINGDKVCLGPSAQSINSDEHMGRQLRRFAHSIVDAGLSLASHCPKSRIVMIP